MSSSEWKKYKLGDVVELRSGKSRPKEIGKYPVYGGNGILDYANQFNASDDTIIIGRVGAYCGSVYFERNRIWISDNALYAKSKGDFSSKFLYYCLKDRNLNSLAGGSSHPLLTQGQLNQIDIKLPNEKTQYKIAIILSSLDDKIELNHQTNKTLEAIAQTLFKEMCLPKGEELPKGWRIGTLGEVLEIKYGKDHKHLESGQIPVYGSGGIMRYADKALYEKESILIPRKGTLSNLFYINKPFWSVDTMFYTKITDSTYTKFLFLLLKSMNLASMNVGSAVPSLTTEILNNLEIIIPSKDVLKTFDEMATPIFETLESNEQESQTLAAIRDSLLPKLMKGEIEI